LASNGVDLPVLNVFRMFGLMGGQRVAVESTADARVDSMRKTGVRGKPDVSALASLQPGKLCVLVWHYHDDDVPGPTAAVDLSLTGLPAADGRLLLNEYRIDRQHSNSFEAWKRMGSPQQPTPLQYAELRQAGQLALLTSPQWLRAEKGQATLSFELPRQAVSLLVITWNAQSTANP